MHEVLNKCICIGICYYFQWYQSDTDMLKTHGFSESRSDYWCNTIMIMIEKTQKTTYQLCIILRAYFCNFTQASRTEPILLFFLHFSFQQFFYLFFSMFCSLSSNNSVFLVYYQLFEHAWLLYVTTQRTLI